MRLDLHITPVIGRIIAVTCIFFGLQLLVRQLTGTPWVEAMGALILRDPDGLPYWQGWRLLTYALLHHNISHLLMNMLGLWLVGAALEDALGGRRLLTLYAVSVVLGGLSAIFCSQMGWNGPQPTEILLGASAGTLGVLFTYVCLAPKSTMYLWLIILIPIKAYLLGIGMVAYQLGGLLFNSGATSSYSAHLGGMLGGFLIAQGLRRHWDIAVSRWFQERKRQWKRRHIKVIK